MSRSANFKVETSKDVEQDQDIDTLTTTLNNLDQSIISPNIINLGGEGGVQILTSNGNLQLGVQMNNSLTTWMNTKLDCSDISTTKIRCNGILDCVSDCSLSGDTLCTLKGDNRIISYTNASISGINEITCNKLNYTELNPPINIPAEPLKQLLTYYVDASIGDDDVNDGSRERPYKTIQKAITICESVWDGVAREIKVAFGSYVENLTISKPRIQIVGECPTRYANVACGINGNISVNIPSGFVDMFNSQVCLMGFQIVGQIIDTSASVHTLNIKDCFLYGQEHIIKQSTRGAEQLLNGSSYTPKRYTSVDCRTYLENCTINASNANGTNPLVLLEAGNLEMTSCNITAKSPDTNCLRVSKNALICTCISSNFTNDSTSATLKSLVYVFEIFGSTTTNTFNNCGFLFGSATSKTVNPSTGVNSAIANDSRDDYFIVLRCGFALQGVSPTVTNFIIVPNYPNSGSLRLSQSGNVSAIGTAYKISTSGVTSYAFTTVS